MKTEIEFIKDPETGRQQVLDLVRQIAEAGRQQTDKLQMYKFIIRGMDFLKRYGLQHAFKQYFQTNREDGRPYTIKLVKELKNHVPLLEFRVNWEGSGAFRAVFFEFEHNGFQILCFTRAIVKESTYDLGFEDIVKETEAIYLDFLASPEKYINLSGVEEHD